MIYNFTLFSQGFFILLLQQASNYFQRPTHEKYSPTKATI
jgi:hypothetical protein